MELLQLTSVSARTHPPRCSVLEVFTPQQLRLLQTFVPE